MFQQTRSHDWCFAFRPRLSGYDFHINNIRCILYVWCFLSVNIQSNSVLWRFSPAFSKQLRGISNYRVISKNPVQLKTKRVKCEIYFERMDIASRFAPERGMSFVFIFKFTICDLIYCKSTLELYQQLCCRHIYSFFRNLVVLFNSLSII